MTNKAQLEAANWQLAHTWHDGLGLAFAGVDLGDALTYAMLTVVGRIEITTQAQQDTQKGEAANG